MKPALILLAILAVGGAIVWLIDRLFYHYEPDSIMAADPEYFIQGLFEIKCGSRSTKD